MKLKKYNKIIKNKYDPVRIIYRNIYSKHKTKISNYNIAQINSILFNYSIPNSTQIIKVYYKEMIYLCDKREYIKYIFTYEEIYEKMKLLGYIYCNNFRPPPNYLPLDNYNRNIMHKLLIYKQELIDRYNYYMMIKENNLNDKNIDYEDNNINLKPLYDSSDDKKTKNNIISKKSTSKNKVIINNKNTKGNIKKNVHFSNETFNLKSYISGIEEESKYESKGVSKYMEPAPIKDDEEKNENSIDSVMKIMDYFKIKENDSINLKKTKKSGLIYNLKNNKSSSSLKLNQGNNKRRFTGEFLINQNKIINLIKNFRKNFGKTNKYYLSIEKFKENLEKNNKMKDRLEKYWKINKNFVTNLIESKNLKIKNKNLLNSYLTPTFSFNSTLDNSISKNIHNKFYNLVSLSPQSKLSTINNNNTTKLFSLSPQCHSNICFTKYKLSSNINKNKFTNSFGNKKTKNSLLMIIRNDSNYMKKKKFSCVEKKIKLINKMNNSIKNINNKNLTFSPFKKSNNLMFSQNNRNNQKNSFNCSNKYDYFGINSLSN